MTDEHAKYLMKVWNQLSKRPRREGRKLFPDRPTGYQRAAEDLACFACNVATAIACRLRGDIQAAQVYEHNATLSYIRLPVYAMDVADELENAGRPVTLIE